CSWTNWMSDHSPDAVGDMETILQLRRHYSFCNTSDILAVRCRDSKTKRTPEELGQLNVLCEINRGLVCINSNQLLGQCVDYEVSFLCDPYSPGCKLENTPSDLLSTSTSTAESTAHDGTSAFSTGTTETTQLCKQVVNLQEDMLSASSFRDDSYAPGHARLGDANCWMPAATDISPYIQVSFMTWQMVSGITTQGHAGASLFVRTFIIKYSTDGIMWHSYREAEGQDKIFYGNIDSTTPVRNLFHYLIRARYLRIIPVSWNHEIAMRFQLHGSIQVTPLMDKLSLSDMNCTDWDQWLDLNHPNLTHRDEVEPIADLIAHSLFCKNPMAIECRPEPFVRPQTSAPMMSCNLWEGFKCLVSDGNGPVCNNYKVRLGCLKETPECISRQTNPVPVCNPDLDTSFCPESCQQGFYCNGTKCVPRSSCPCNINGKVVMPHGVERDEKCNICQCQSGETMCAPLPQCPSCAKGISYRDTDSCECQCLTCKTNEYQCGDGSCIDEHQKCDCIVDCIDDELGCG
ncbi:unnamed protein product, partial [Candidula unifasciata]